jgi:hypothetical protein
VVWSTNPPVASSSSCCWSLAAQAIDSTLAAIACLELEDGEERLERRALLIGLEALDDLGADRGKTELGAQGLDAFVLSRRHRTASASRAS